MTDTAENIAALAAAFAALLQRDLTAEQWATMRVRNMTNGDDVCASHDFIDSNMTMAEAFEVVTGRESVTSWETLADGSPVDPAAMVRASADCNLWNEAWGRAAELYLTERATLDDLTEEWAAYCEREGLSHECALETLMFADLTDTQREFVARFNARWDALQDAADLAETVRAHGGE